MNMVCPHCAYFPLEKVTAENILGLKVKNLYKCNKCDIRVTIIIRKDGKPKYTFNGVIK